MFLSFIVPIYNAEKYLPECLDSLLNQGIDSSEYEIICINDGSTDNCEQVINYYSSTHTNIRKINKPNGGVSSARNLGLEIATGEWVWFVDADDFIQTNILSELKELEKSEIDRVDFLHYCFNNNLNDVEVSQKEQNEIVSNNPGQGIWCSLFRRSIIHQYQIQFDVEIDYGEDIVWASEYREHMHKAVRYEKVCYFYRIHSKSAMHQVTTAARIKKIKSYIKASSSLLKIYQSQLVKKSNTADEVMFLLRMTMLQIACISSYRERKQYYNEVREKGLFPFTPLKEAKLNNAYVTNRSDIIGKTYNYLVVNSTRQLWFQLLVLWQQLYACFK